MQFGQVTTAVRPAHLDHVGVAAVGVGEELDGGLEGFWGVDARVSMPEAYRTQLLSQLYYYRSTWNTSALTCTNELSAILWRPLHGSLARSTNIWVISYQNMSRPFIAVANQKGGVGKTTTAINLAASLARARTAQSSLVDLDPQGNLTSGLGQKGNLRRAGTIYDALTRPIRSSTPRRS